MRELDEITACYRAVNTALHKLWTAAVGSPGYDKAAWREFEDNLECLARSAMTAAGLPAGRPLLAMGERFDRSPEEDHGKEPAKP